MRSRLRKALTVDELPIIGYRRDGSPIPLIAGAADGDGDGGDGGDGDGDGGDDGSGDGEDDADDKDTGAKKVIAAEREAKRKAVAAKRAAETRAKAAETELAKLKAAANSGDADKQLEAAREEARREAKEEADKAANLRIIRAEVKAVAGGRLADPNDAVRLLDLAEFDVDDDGEVDEDAIKAAIDTLLKAKPYLAGKAGKVAGDADQGARGKSTEEKVTPGAGRIARAYANNTKK